MYGRPVTQSLPTVSERIELHKSRTISQSNHSALRPDIPVDDDEKAGDIVPRQTRGPLAPISGRQRSRLAGPLPYFVPA